MAKPEIRGGPPESLCRRERGGIGAWVAFYNDRRPHQALAYRTPMAVWRGGREPAVDMLARLDNAGALPTCPQQQQQQQQQSTLV